MRREREPGAGVDGKCQKLLQRMSLISTQAALLLSDDPCLSHPSSSDSLNNKIHLQTSSFAVFNKQKLPEKLQINQGGTKSLYDRFIKSCQTISHWALMPTFIIIFIRCLCLSSGLIILRGRGFCLCPLREKCWALTCIKNSFDV